MTTPDPAPELIVLDTADCPEYCDHPGRCADERAAIHRAETLAENAWLRLAEAGYPGYDYDPNDPRATGW